MSLAIAMMSCSEPSEEEMKGAATELCNCMSSRKELREESDYAESDDMDIVDFGFCAVEVEGRNINTKSDKFVKIVKESCPDIAEIQQRYIEASKK